MNNNRQRGGLHIGALILVFIIIFVLQKVNLGKAINSQQLNSNTSYLEQKGKELWQQYLSKPALYIWNNMFSDLLTNGVKQIKNNGGLNFNAPVVDTPNFDKIMETNRASNYTNPNTIEESPVNPMSNPVSN